MSRVQPTFSDWPLQTNVRQPSITSSLSSPSDTNSIRFPNVNLPPTPALSGTSDRLTNTTSEHSTLVPLTRPVHIAFSKGSKLFKLKYTQVQLRRNAGGHLKQIELGDPAGLSSTFLHSFTESRLPIPHLEQPVTSTGSHISRVAFLEEDQTVQLAQSLFQAQPQYTFETWEGTFDDSRRYGRS
jgi:hypothetical protein